ncbi:ribonuclease HII [Halorarum salinum]|uniref:Ribonuclease HII n=1 Tax=Halorarum salinum TaxID=2743089 RepID=A0A7D5L9S4_9EURY|nr:ribonuclease HII [Halobaculum salinum]QLG61310.1 ribonuclease HII [Halobaculum salinum]
MLGADEAGKGPVLGPMVAAAVRAPEAAIPDGVDDSKRLAPARREELDARLRGHPDVDVGLAVVTTSRIDDPGTDMNSLTVAGQAEALAAVAAEGDEAIVDAGDVSEARFARRVGEGVAGTEPGVDLAVAAEHGADESYPIVAAASVLAKVERDRLVAGIAEEYAAYGEVGSGYPSDPTTREFLRKYVREEGDLPDCARRSWATCADVLAAAEQSALGEF